MPDQSVVMAVLYLAAVLFFALWLNERGKRNVLLRLFDVPLGGAWAEIDRHQMARLRAREDAEPDAMRENV